MYPNWKHVSTIKVSTKDTFLLPAEILRSRMGYGLWTRKRIRRGTSSYRFDGGLDDSFLPSGGGVGVHGWEEYSSTRFSNSILPAIISLSI